MSYISDWNTKGIASITDHRRGNNPSQLTEEKGTLSPTRVHMIWVMSKTGGAATLSLDIIEEKYGRKYSKAWVSLLLKSLGFTYKRGVFHSSLVDALLQESFKKNGLPVGFY